MSERRIKTEIGTLIVPASIRFVSYFDSVGALPAFSEAEIKAEPMMFSADPGFARSRGGPITRAFLDRLPWEPTIIDSRVHMLMPGWFPCIPGWHLDDVPRTRADGQPDHVSPAYESVHLASVVGDSSLTRFACGTFNLLDVPEGRGVVYGEWHREIERLLRHGQVREETITPGAIIEFDWQAFHRGSAATKNGWRFFIRASRNTTRPAHNEVRTQVQVYLSALEAGW